MKTQRVLPWLLLTGLVVAIGLGFLAWSQTEHRLASVTTELEASKSSLAQCEAEQTECPDQEPAVYISGSSILPPKDVEQFRTRIVEPFLEYHKGRPIASFYFEKSSSLPEYPYSVTVLSRPAGYEGWLISRAEDGGVQWFLPECMEECTFSDAFREKYPEIVRLSQEANNP